MVYQEDGKRAFILAERRGLSPLAKKPALEEIEIRLLGYFQMPDGTLVFDLAKLPEILESYDRYLR